VSPLSPADVRSGDLRDDAERWRIAAGAVADVVLRLAAPLADLDATDSGADATACVLAVWRIGLVGGELSDVMAALAGALDSTADGVDHLAARLPAGYPGDAVTEILRSFASVCSSVHEGHS
jgi:hypothetical protein